MWFDCSDRWKKLRQCDIFSRKVVLIPIMDNDGLASPAPPPPASPEAETKMETAEEARKRKRKEKLKAAADEADAMIRHLNPVKVGETLRNGTFALFFGASYCPLTQRYTPKWLDFQHLYDVTLAWHVHFTIYKIQCADDEQFCVDMGVDGYPTILLWRDGRLLAEWDTDEVVRDAVAFVASDTGQRTGSEQVTTIGGDANTKWNTNFLTDKVQPYSIGDTIEVSLVQTTTRSEASSSSKDQPATRPSVEPMDELGTPTFQILPNSRAKKMSPSILLLRVDHPTLMSREPLAKEATLYQIHRTGLESNQSLFTFYTVFALLTMVGVALFILRVRGRRRTSFRRP
ncbi:hypothetical protein BC830DRAFT_177314 [Chytriomyces sp. MP71]|nr:hypothetical protein BC830DRAFT_177314 [Chytriomyces sp. MP71]